MKTLVSVVVPLYDEEENVGPLVEELDAALGPLDGYEYELVLVNDGSNDSTGAVMDRLASAHAGIRPLHFRRNSGQSACK